MQVSERSIAVTGAASGLGLATTKHLIEAGAKVTLIDLAGSEGESVARELGDSASFIPADVTDTDEFSAALRSAHGRGGLRGLVHCAGAGRRMRVLEKDGSAGSLEDFEAIIRLNLIGSFNALRFAAECMAQNDPVEGDRGAIVLTASIAAFEGQIGQINYSAAKGGIVGMTLVAARDLASKGIRVCTIAPGLMDTPPVGRQREDVRNGLISNIPHPHRLGEPREFGLLAEHILANAYLNGEVIRMDGALRMAPR